MQLKITSAKLVGNPGPTGWVQVHDFLPEEEEKLRLRGHFYAVISVHVQDPNLDNIALGREILTRLHEEYFGRLELSAFEALKGAIAKVSFEASSFSGVKSVEIAAGAFVENALYTAVQGQTQAAIFRNNIMANILIGQDEKTTSASGYPQEGDVFLLGTKLFFDIFSEEIVKNALKDKSLDRVAESLAPTISSAKDAEQIGAVFISFNHQEEWLNHVNFNHPPVSEEPRSKAVSLGLMARLKTIAGGIMQKLPAKSIYVKKGEETSEEVKSKKTTFSVGAILLVLLLVSIIFGVHQNRIKKIKLSYQAKLTQAEHSLDESIQLFSINPERSRELFLESSNLTKEMLGQGIKDTKLSELEKKLAENKGKILSEYSPGPQAYSDLSLLSSGFTAQLMNTSTEKALFLDTGKKILVSVDLETKKAKVEAGPEQLEGAKEAAFYSDSFYVLTEDGIYKVGKERTKVIDKGWEGESLIYAYAGNIYVLDKGRSEIYRYAGLASGFSEQKSWLAPGISLDLTNTSGWAIDGSIWVGSANGSIFKITQGVPKNINPAGVNPPLENIKAIYSNEEIEGVYVLDSINSRVIVLDKEGVYKASYFSDKLSEAKGLAVSESKKLIIFLAEENKLYSLELEHLD